MIKNLAAKLQTNGVVSLSGFYTGELRNESNSRIGFDVTEITNEAKTAVLAKVTQDCINDRNSPRVGKYSVDVKSFESIALPSLRKRNEKTIYLIDEIGKMESFSSSFERETLKLLGTVDVGKFIIVATVPIRNMSLSDKFKSHPLSKLYTVTVLNRDGLVDEIYEEINQSYRTL